MNSFGLIIEFHHILIHSRIQMESKRSFLWYFLLHYFIKLLIVNINQKFFLLTIKTYGHDNPHIGSLYILPMYYLYAK